MNVKHLLATAAITASALTFGSALAPAAPLDPPPTDPNPAAPAHPRPPLPARSAGRTGESDLAAPAAVAGCRATRRRVPLAPALSARLSCR